MDITPGDSIQSTPAPAAYFTGTVWQQTIADVPAPGRLRALLVTFAPGARTAWHTHPLGQTLHVTAGCGRIQSRGGPVRTIRAGDTVWIPPGEEHWHGAAPDALMTHLAMQESQDGIAADWLEQVSDADYRGTG